MSISETIEKFIISNIGDDSTLSLSRNNLAQYFNCAPSQINYVLKTRFNFEKGYVTESRKGGGGYIKISKLSQNKNQYINNIILSLKDKELTVNQANNIINGLEEKGYITKNEKMIMSSSINPRAIATPFKIENKLRSQVLENILINLLQRS